MERSRLSGLLKLRFRCPLSLALAGLAASESRRAEMRHGKRSRRI